LSPETLKHGNTEIEATPNAQRPTLNVEFRKEKVGIALYHSCFAGVDREM
jgi:hypothetical protein